MKHKPKQQHTSTHKKTSSSKKVHSLLPDESLHRQYVRTLHARIKTYRQDIHRYAAHLCGNITTIKKHGTKLLKVKQLTTHEEANLLAGIRFLREKIVKTQEELIYQTGEGL